MYTHNNMSAPSQDAPHQDLYSYPTSQALAPEEAAAQEAAELYAQQYAQYAQQMAQAGNIMTPAGIATGEVTPEMLQMQIMQGMQGMQGMQTMQNLSTGFNSLGLPIREGSQICTYFSNYGECKFGSACKYNHPESFAGFAMARQEAATLAANGFGTNSTLIPLVGTGPPTNLVNSLGYPIRPGQEACSFFSRTGVCRYAATCKWDHPEEFAHLASTDMAKNLLPKVEVAGFNTSGYPIRPGAESCNFYLKNGTCKFGPSCKWDHPEGKGGSGGKQESSLHGGGPMPVRQPPNPPPMVTDAEVAYAAVTTAQQFNRSSPY